jgi:hypothetical protein
MFCFQQLLVLITVIVEIQQLILFVCKDHCN